MKFVALTFDDGRSDNYLVAKKIMDKYSLLGTVFITTGFIDGTWSNYSVLESPTRPLRVEEIKEMHNSGWEIGLHGDQHKTQVKDMNIAIKKMRSWQIDNLKWGMSIPNSVTEETVINNIFNSNYGSTISYIRRGRKCNIKKIKFILLYVIYRIFKFKWAYRIFNSTNIFNFREMDKGYIPSIVVKSNDKPELIIDFISKMPDNVVVVLMLHSILESKHKKYNIDKWSWSDKNFDRLCSYLREAIDLGILEVKPLINIIHEENIKNECK